MPARKIAVRPPIARNNGKSVNGKYMDDHPELQTGYWKNQVMTYDSAVAVERNEIDFMRQSLQKDISDGKAIQNSLRKFEDDCLNQCFTTTHFWIAGTYLWVAKTSVLVLS